MQYEVEWFSNEYFRLNASYSKASQETASAARKAGPQIKTKILHVCLLRKQRDFLTENCCPIFVSKYLSFFVDKTLLILSTTAITFIKNFICLYFFRENEYPMSGLSTSEYKNRASNQQVWIRKLCLWFPNLICLFTIFKSGGSSPPTSADSRLLDAAETLVTLQSVSSRGQGKYHDTKSYSITRICKFLPSIVFCTERTCNDDLTHWDKKIHLQSYSIQSKGSNI